MQIAITLVIAIMATTAQAGLLSNLPVAGGLFGRVPEITKNLPVVGSVVNNLGETLPIGSATENLPIVSDINGVPLQGLAGVVEQVLVLVNQTVATLLNGPNGIAGAANVATNVNVADITKLPNVAKVPNVASVV